MQKSLYVALFSVGASLSFYKIGLLASILEKSDFGSYSLVISSYIYVIYFFSFGANEYVLKKGSLVSSESERERVRNKALWTGLSAILLGLLLCYPVFLFILKEAYTEIFISCALMAIVALSFNVFESYFRTQGALLKFSGMMAGKSALAVTIILFFSFIDSFIDAVLIELAAMLVILLMAVANCLKSGESFFSRLCIKDLKEVIKDGYAFSLASMLKNSVSTLDRFFVSMFLGMVMLGYYAFSMIIYQAAILASGALMSVLGPKIIRLANDEINKSCLARKFAVAALFLGLVSSLIYMPFTVGYEWVVVNYFDQYNAEITFELLPWVYFSAVATFVSAIVDWYYISISKEKYLTVLSAISLTVAVLSFFIIGELNLELWWFGFAFLITRLIVLLGQFYFVVPELRKAK